MLRPLPSAQIAYKAAAAANLSPTATNHGSCVSSNSIRALDNL